MIRALVTMRALCAGLSLIVLASGSTGCASTVARLDGEFPTAAGVATSNCEKASWLVPAPTRASLFDPSGRRTETRDDGVGLYRVGAKDPESIPSIGEELGPDAAARVERHRDAVRPHDTKRWVAAGLGASGIIAIAAGALLFVSGFDNSGGEHSVNRPRVIWGSVLVGAGFGLGLSGTVLNPNQAERSRADAARYVFLPPADGKDDVLSLTARHNQEVRARCGRGATP